jgi:hypothetical protein
MNEMEVLANRFSQLQWEVYNMPFIVINEDQQITPIYRDVSSIPKPLRDFQQRNLNMEFIEYDRMS